MWSDLYRIYCGWLYPRVIISGLGSGKLLLKEILKATLYNKQGFFSNQRVFWAGREVYPPRFPSSETVVATEIFWWNWGFCGPPQSEKFLKSILHIILSGPCFQTQYKLYYIYLLLKFPFIFIWTAVKSSHLPIIQDSCFPIKFSFVDPYFSLSGLFWVLILLLFIFFHLTIMWIFGSVLSMWYPIILISLLKQLGIN